MGGFAASDYVQLLVAGLSTGSIYVLIGLGLIAIYNVTGIINLAQGEFVMLGAMLAVALHRLGLPLAAAGALAVSSVVLVGLAVHRLTVVPARSATDVTMIIITIGTSIALRGLALLFWGTTPYSLPDFTPGPPLPLLGAVVGRQRLWITGVAALVLLLLYTFFEHTVLGKALRACAINRRAAQILGVDPQAMAALAYGLGAGLSAIAGIVIAPLTLVSYDMGLTLGLKGFVVAVMGGLTNMPAAVIGGLLLGVLEAFSSALLTSGLKDGVAFLALFAVLVLRTINLRALRLPRLSARRT
ncbi:MAG: branched-chain amino acid ABC transporter permease [Chloroflexi bacterium]|nr:branched-chain amino acid ABC transporter permease [Chloroflexota bacterium]